MQVDDRIYGESEIDAAVLRELLGSAPVQRLQAVAQAGPASLLMDKPVSRYEHSVGVMLLLQRFDAPLAEQVAGLLHDVPHTAFSHVADFVFPNDDHEFHERFTEQVIQDSDIPAILQEHGFALDEILDQSAFGLLERDLPDLCADRIDYFLRDWHAHTGERLDRLLDAVGVADGRFVVTDRGLAEEYALRYIEADERWWAHPREVAAYDLFADAIRAALDAGGLTRDDLFGTDDELLEALQRSDVDRVQAVLDLFEDGFDVERVEEDPDIVADTKVRYVDPVVAGDGGRCRVTDYSEVVEQRIAEHREELAGGYRLRIVRH
ncbi:MAG: HD domain-containing protein [Candidatus Nanohaloarchaea archaeon]|nr:HD domain-containing protein [Candidatus Nanohaloarchaea archaeon]